MSIRDAFNDRKNMIVAFQSGASVNILRARYRCSHRQICELLRTLLGDEEYEKLCLQHNPRYRPHVPHERKNGLIQ